LHHSNRVNTHLDLTVHGRLVVESIPEVRLGRTSFLNALPADRSVLKPFRAGPLPVSRSTIVAHGLNTGPRAGGNQSVSPRHRLTELKARPSTSSMSRHALLKSTTPGYRRAPLSKRCAIVLIR
jgi:hypothetical protein